MWWYCGYKMCFKGVIKCLEKDRQLKSNSSSSSSIAWRWDFWQQNLHILFPAPPWDAPWRCWQRPLWFSAACVELSVCLRRNRHRKIGVAFKQSCWKIIFFFFHQSNLMKTSSRVTKVQWTHKQLISIDKWCSSVRVFQSFLIWIALTVSTKPKIMKELEKNEKCTWAGTHSLPQRSLAWEHPCRVWSSGCPQRSRCPAGWLLSGSML